MRAAFRRDSACGSGADRGRPAFAGIRLVVLWDILGPASSSRRCFEALLKKGNLKPGTDIGWMSALEALLVVVVTIGFVFMQSNYPLLFLVPPGAVASGPSPWRSRSGCCTADRNDDRPWVHLLRNGVRHAGGRRDRPFICYPQAFLAANAYMALSLGASVSERHRLTQRLSNSRRRIVGRSNALKRTLLATSREWLDEIRRSANWTLQSGTGEVLLGLQKSIVFMACRPRHLIRC